MSYINKPEIRKLKEDPMSFAVMLEDDQLEHVIAVFVSVLNQRIKDRGG